MGQRHKHADVIIAWAEGKDIQVWDEGTKRWYDIGGKFLLFNEDREHRIKPPAKKYRVALFHRQNSPWRSRCRSLLSRELCFLCNVPQPLPLMENWGSIYSEVEEKAK